MLPVLVSNKLGTDGFEGGEIVHTESLEPYKPTDIITALMNVKKNKTTPLFVCGVEVTKDSTAEAHKSCFQQTESRPMFGILSGESTAEMLALIEGKMVNRKGGIIYIALRETDRLSITNYRWLGDIAKKHNCLVIYHIRT